MSGSLHELLRSCTLKAAAYTSGAHVKRSSGIPGVSGGLFCLTPDRQ